MQWIATREPRPPAALVERMSRALSENPSPTGAPIHSQLMTAAIGILAQGAFASEQNASDEQSTGARMSDRRAALELLAADALVTYAMEYASNDCTRVDAVASSAMRAICELR